MDYLAVHHESPVPDMVDRFRTSLRRIDPGLEHFQNKEIISADQTGVDDPALEIGEVLGDQWRRYSLGGQRRQPCCRELVGVPPRTVPDLDGPLRKFDGGDRDQARARG